MSHLPRPFTKRRVWHGKHTVLFCSALSAKFVLCQVGVNMNSDQHTWLEKNEVVLILSSFGRVDMIHKDKRYDLIKELHAFTCTDCIQLI